MTAPSIPIPPSILRIAAQLGQDPETIAAGILHHAARVVDWNLATGCHPLTFATDGDDLAGFDITAAMDRLTPRQLAGLDTEEPTPQRGLAVREWQRRGVEFQPWPGE